MLAVLASVPSEYRRRTPEAEPLYQVLAGHLETFLALTRATDQPLPAYVERELRAYGFVRARCSACGHRLRHPGPSGRRPLTPGP